MTSKIKTIEKKYKDTLRSPEFNFGAIQEIVSEIHALPVAQKSEILDLYKQIGQELFDRGVNVSNYNLNLLQHDIKEWREKGTVKKVKSTEESLESLLDQRVVDFIGNIKDVFIYLKRFIILRLDSSTPKETKIVILHDLLSKNPYLTKIQQKLQYGCEIVEMNDFIDNRLKGKEYQNNNFIILMALSAGIESKNNSTDYIDRLETEFGTGNVRQVKVLNLDVPEFQYEKDIQSIKQEISYLVEIDLTNAWLLPSAEKIIKKFYKEQNISNIVYRELTGGFSGAQVLEIQPFKGTTRCIRSIIKFGNLQSSKLENESTNFKSHVARLDSRYTLQEETTEQYRAIQYDYASGDSVIDSKSFYENVSEMSDNDAVDIIDKLFGINLFKQWGEDETLIGDQEIGKLYENYINLEKIIRQIAVINNTTVEKVKSSVLIRNFNKITQHKLNIRRKVCHGDLHTRNFFIDNNGEVFLIDFGDTGFHHALIDYTTLECSVKFQHFPRYLDIEDLLKIENELMGSNTFNSTYAFKYGREDLTKFLKIISKARELGKGKIVDNQSVIEYLISLFFITFRQIKYVNLNQLYALKSAEKLSEEIVKNI